MSNRTLLVIAAVLGSGVAARACLFGSSKRSHLVERVWKGKLSSHWTITQDLGSSCDSTLRRNVRYVIFATRLDDGKFRVAGVSDGALSIVADRLDGKIEPPRLTIGR